MNKFNKGDWVLTHNGKKGIVVGFDTRPPPASVTELVWVLLIGESSPYLFDLLCLEKIEEADNE